MYILKSAWRNVIRSKGRSILIGVIILAIALSSCLALSIRAAAEQTRKSALEAMNITAAISVNRTALMQQADGEEAAAPDRQKALQNIPELTLEELETYAQAESVKDFTYEKTLSMDAGEEYRRDTDHYPGQRGGRLDGGFAAAGDRCAAHSGGQCRGSDLCGAVRTAGNPGKPGLKKGGI